MNRDQKSHGVSYGNCRYSEKQQDVLLADGTSAGLRRQSVDVFRYLAENHDQVMSRDDIHSSVWNHTAVADDSLNQCISEIRKAIGDADRRILKTVPRRGYMLVADTTTDDNTTVEKTTPRSTPKTNFTARAPKLIFAVACMGAIVGIAAFVVWSNRGAPIDTASVPPNSAAYLGNTASTKQDTPQIAITVVDEESSRLNSIASNTRIALSRYRSVSVVNHDNADYIVQLADHSSGAGDTSVELINGYDQTLVFAEIISPEDIPPVDTKEPVVNDAETQGVRIAGMIASPGSGAVARHLMNSARGKSLEELDNSQCYAYGYGCTNCSGELDPITAIAKQCIDRLLKERPEDARAWALQSTLYANQYFWSSALSEPARTNLRQRGHLPQLALEAANRAEQYSDGTDTSVYFGMGQAYMASCETDKLRTVMERGLQINPDDPSLLGAFGNWLAYSGDWDAGVSLVNKALVIEPRFYKRWWLFAIAKRHYARGEYEEALKVFQTSYNERNWLSHLQLAYTLPYLDRKDEAIKERKLLERLYPSITIEKVLQFYKTYCFEDSFLEKMQWGLAQSGLPSRGNADDFDNIRPPEAKILPINGFETEYIDIGDGTPIVFVHGSISDYRAWSHYQNPISESHRFISYSLRYAGSQQWPDNGEKFGIATDANDLIALVEELGLGPVITVSWSRGGRVTGLAALLRPDLFRGNIHFEPIVNVLGNTKDPSILQAKEAFFARFEDSTKEFAANNLEKGNQIILENVFEVERGQFIKEIMPLRAMNRDQGRNMQLQLSAKNQWELSCKMLAKTKVPTLVVLGERTNAWWTHVIQRYHSCVPGAELRVMRGVNHDGPVRDPEQLTEIILGFVESIADAAN